MPVHLTRKWLFPSIVAVAWACALFYLFFHIRFSHVATPLETPSVADILALLPQEHDLLPGGGIGADNVKVAALTRAQAVATEISAQLQNISAKPNPPHELPFGRSSQFYLVAQGDAGGPVEYEIDTGGGMSIIRTITPSNQLSARLRAVPGSDVDISPSEQQEGSITPIGPTNLVWDLKPKVYGHVTLVLEVSDLAQLDYKPAPIPFGDAKQYVIPVTSTVWDKVKSSSEEIGPLLAVLATTITLLITLARFIFDMRQARLARRALSDPGED
jgi:hypothetical protein